ncbi:hypothetical protein DM02DRAFT_653302 [Periconia macrospinosa]|uniref:Uncharacterized protein n=1 Tax=Periconia macrospinosa TaxID=97972 RepID=A0A2V1DWA3_9PLEO|nr:hypothetical protein DM02DRAFT_653302 [Periconia macrospinosa]
MLARLFTNRTAAVGFLLQIFVAIGLGFLITTVLPAIQSSLPESDVAFSTGTHAFLRSYGFIWGFLIPNLIFNINISDIMKIVGNAEVRPRILNGAAYSQPNSEFFHSLSGWDHEQVLQLYTGAFTHIWYGAIGFALLATLSTLIEKRIPLRTEVNTEYGIERDEKDAGVETMN